MSAPAPPLAMSDTDREVLAKVARSTSAAHREVIRARVLLDAADGVGNRTIAAEHGISAMTVRAWRSAFAAEGLKYWGTVKKGRGRKPSIPAETIAEIVRMTTKVTPKGQTHWSSRSLAKELGISHSTVHRVWSELGLKPHRVDTFKVSNDPAFDEKVIDVVGLYLNPPEQAVVLAMDEKSSVQALDRTQASLPMVPGRAGTMTHDYKRHGTTTLFAALDVLTGKVIGQCLPKHRHEEFLKFLATIDQEVPDDLEVHLILDNYATHKHAKVKEWMTKHPRFHFHFTPTSASWLNQVERWFRDLTEKNLRRGIFRSVPELIDSIEDYMKANNQNPKPYVWTATAESILEKVTRARASLNEQANQN
ncbi:IS630 family transposase [Nesterenkonia aerolata]|uniref:IS630 family transposase n=1 Tax=Nesterenkonia aerolata TaxID=3074079 RepID=A0ABU2DVI3_9MICC|nr:IS630 family transposase [Nesterenkonia sp. LY-0111]MDR8020513.1 IS630 family transposase [Nesterenkonia sp. LY-0111]